MCDERNTTNYKQHVSEQQNGSSETSAYVALLRRKKTANGRPSGTAAITLTPPLCPLLSFPTHPALATEWRRAVDRLTNLNTVLSPSTKAATAAAAAIKNALAGLGALARPEEAAGADPGAKAQPEAAHGGSGGSRGSGGGISGAGGDGDEFVSSQEGW